MRVLAVNGSARTGGNTAMMLEAALEPLRAAGIECELVEMGGHRVEGCRACRACQKKKDRACHGRDDFGNEVIAKMDAADAILLGSPVYFADVTAEMKALIDRAGYVARANGDMFARKPAAGVIAVRRAGSVHALDSINHLFLIGQMLIVGSHYWNMGFGGGSGEVAEDAEGLDTMRILGENMAWLLGKLHA